MKLWPIVLGMVISVGAGFLLASVILCLFGNGHWDGLHTCRMLGIVVAPVLLFVGGAIAGAVATTGRRGALCGLLAGLPSVILIVFFYIQELWWPILVYLAGILALSTLSGFLGGRSRGYLRRRRQGLPADG